LYRSTLTSDSGPPVQTRKIHEQARRNLQKKLPPWVQPFEDWLRLCPFEIVDDPTLELVTENLALMRQAEDAPVALAAMAAHVDYFVSEDKDFMEESPTTVQVRKRLRILRPVIFLRSAGLVAR
jgi:hypothetical protein